MNESEPELPTEPANDDAAREAYASAVEDYFLRRRGSAILVSPKDWALVSGWFDEGVPIPIVLSGLAEVFDKAVATGRIEPISSISYCRHAVNKRFAEYSRASVGGAAAGRPRKKKKDSANDPEKRLSERFRETAVRLESTAPEVSVAIVDLLPEIEILETDDGTPLSDREGRLIEIERRFAAGLLAKLDPADRKSIEDEATLPLDRLRTSPPPEEIARLREIGLLRAFRHRYALPRFTLLPR